MVKKSDSSIAVKTEAVFDVAVIGAGIVGSAVARCLSGYKLNVAMVEGKNDIGDGTSKANTAILHTGFDATPGSLESKLVARGYALLSRYTEDAGIPVERTGAVVVAWDENQLESLPEIKKKAIENGYDKSYLVDAEKVYGMVPALGPGVRGGLVVPDEAIICTWTTNLALATEAVNRGVVLKLNHKITSVQVRHDSTTLLTDSGDRLTAKWVINAAGLGADFIDNLFGHRRFTVTPRRGELVVFDKQARSLVNMVVLPVPTSAGKGVLVSPTVYGNVMVGPTAENLEDRNDTSTSEAGLNFLMEKVEKLMPSLLEEEITANYAGLRAASDHSDYLIEIDEAQRYLLVGGIRSTGLTSGMAIAEYIEQSLVEKKAFDFIARTDLPSVPVMPNIGEAFSRPYESAELIELDSAYGKIVCFCERVTLGEIRDTFKSSIPPVSLEGLRRRTRVQIGRCQGFYCGAEVREILDGRESLGLRVDTPAEEIRS